uniref:Uncharacterized protein n=1 Tax=Entomoneis paludosa TaxID=265537 RepID=A0A6U3DBG4_9STRA|mmetsp:Transcript_39033/g.81023  ORF Transcript_39033/g.81023 Transcript_39033/m.81023 type:complete len:299 (+) Transcript_39033:27-923(+)
MARGSNNHSSGNKNSTTQEGGSGGEANNGANISNTTGVDGKNPVGSAWLFSNSGKAPDLQQQHKRRRYFQVNIEPIPSDVQETISKRIRQEKSLRFVQQEQKLKQLRSKLTDQRTKVDQARQWVEELERSKEQGLNDIRTAREEEHHKNMTETAERMKEKHKEVIEKLEEKWKAELEEECKAEVERRSRERQKLVEEQEASLEASAAVESEEASDMKAKIGDDAEETEEEEGEEKEEAVPRSVALQKEIDQLKAVVEKSNQNRVEMIWLLKQIIKAEEKQNSAMESKPKAKIATSKQA